MSKIPEHILAEDVEKGVIRLPQRAPSKTSVRTVNSTHRHRKTIFALRQTRSLSVHDEPNKEHHLLPRMADWLHHEKTKHHARMQHVKHPFHPKLPANHDTASVLPDEDIPRPSSKKFSRHKDVRRTFRGAVAVEGEKLVPSVEVVLDRSDIANEDLLPAHSHSSTAGAVFKLELLRLAHTLQIPGWRRIDLSHSDGIEVARLSGALTNAVYVVTPPASPDESIDKIKRKAKKLLLRIYGPQVEFLIDREQELQILRRLARKAIGPQLLGTFINGRFEEYFEARTLTAADLRISHTFVQIAKRMREMHEGIELLEEERLAGPSVWRNWEKWASRAKSKLEMLDQRTDRVELVCGTPAPIFFATVANYQTWLKNKDQASVADRLVFAHNDTQYGNLLRLQPSGESPLLLPSNEHKQLVVIDFEYASANLPGLEFANHFTEWCYDYHDSTNPHTLHEARYPCLDEQKTFVRAYVQHIGSGRSDIAPSTSISAFMLDSRAPPSQYAEDEKAREQAVELEIDRLLHETRIWRAANSAQWIVWGVIQAKIEGSDATNSKSKALNVQARTSSQESDTLTCDLKSTPSPSNQHPATDMNVLPAQSEVDKQDEQHGFDYLGYAMDRALLFWGDMLQLGIVQEADLSRELLSRVKVVGG